MTATAQAPTHTCHYGTLHEVQQTAARRAQCMICDQKYIILDEPDTEFAYYALPHLIREWP